MELVNKDFLSPDKDLVNDTVLADQTLAINQPGVEIRDPSGLPLTRDAGTDWVADVST